MILKVLGGQVVFSVLLAGDGRRKRKASYKNDCMDNVVLRISHDLELSRD